MLAWVAVAHTRFADYTHIVGRERIDEIRALAAPLRDRRILHVNAKAYGVASRRSRNDREKPARWAPKNMALSREDAVHVCRQLVHVCRQLGIGTGRPTFCRVSRLDPWKDSQEVIDAYRMVKKSRPEVRPALVGSIASDDAKGWNLHNATVAHADGDPDIHILNNFSNVGSTEVNAFQSLVGVVIQASIREELGLTVSGALWKGRSFVGGDVGGIALQVRAGVSDYLVADAAQCAERCLDILEQPDPARDLGRRGKEHVREHFLTPRYLRDYLRIFSEVL